LDLSSCSVVEPESLLHCFETEGAVRAAENGRLVNDLEVPAFVLEPLLAALKEDVERYVVEGTIAGVVVSAVNECDVRYRKCTLLLYCIVDVGFRDNDIRNSKQEVSLI